MSDLDPGPEGSRTSGDDTILFSGQRAEPPRRRFFLGTAAAVAIVAALVFIVLLRGRHDAAQSLNAILPPDPYTTSLSFSQLVMSQSTSLSGGTSTFLDGRVRNSGPDRLTGVTVQVIFRNDVGMSPQVYTLPLSLVRTHEPYIDTEPVSAAPIKPSDDTEFRLVFENIPSNWNQQMPEISVVRVRK